MRARTDRPSPIVRQPAWSSRPHSTCIDERSQLEKRAGYKPSRVRGDLGICCCDLAPKSGIAVGLVGDQRKRIAGTHAMGLAVIWRLEIELAKLLGQRSIAAQSQRDPGA